MNPTPRTDSRPEAMADVQGGCDLSLTRGIILYRERHELEATGGRIEDIGLGLVVEGRFAAESRVVDLGSGRVKALDLSGELIILDWAYEPTVDHVRELVRSSQGDRSLPGDEVSPGPGRERGDPVSKYCFGLASRVLDRAGFGPLTRPVFLRIGFRDICRDLDLHEGTAIRIKAGTSTLCRIHLDYDVANLVVRTASSSRVPVLEAALIEMFPSASLGRSTAAGPSGNRAYHLRFPIPVDWDEARAILREARSGLDGLIGRFEPERHRAVVELLSTFGPRDTLAKMNPHEARGSTVAISAPSPGEKWVH